MLTLTLSSQAISHIPRQQSKLPLEASFCLQVGTVGKQVTIRPWFVARTDYTITAGENSRRHTCVSLWAICCGNAPDIYLKTNCVPEADINAGNSV